MAEGSASGAEPAPVAWVRPLVAMLAVQTAVSFLSRLAPTLAPTLMPRVGGSAESVGYLSSLITGGSMLVLLIGMPFQRRLGAMRMLQIGLALGVLGTLLSALPSAAALVIGSLLIGLSIGPPSSAGMDVLQRFSPPHHRNLLFSVKQAGVPLGGVLAGLAMPLVAETLGIVPAFALAATLGAATLVAVQPLRRAVDAGRDRALRLNWRLFASIDNLRQPLASLSALPNLRRMGIAGGCLGAGQSAWFAFLVTYLVTGLDWSLTSAGALFALMQALSALGRPLAGFVSDRLGDGVRVLRWTASGSGVATMVLALSTPAWPTWSIVVLAVFGGLTVASWNGVQFAEVARLAPRERLNEAMAGATLVLLGAYVLGPAVVGLILTLGASFRTALAVTAVVTFAALIPLGRIGRPG
ncbi:MAG: MFS transporter [Rubrivivax sp.]|nr:MFS transporter [Burkholderiales bacterium]MCW5635172.1 MFS transporter [Rubrivivax sp.]